MTDLLLILAACSIALLVGYLARKRRPAFILGAWVIYDVILTREQMVAISAALREL